LCAIVCNSKTTFRLSSIGNRITLLPDNNNPSVTTAAFATVVALMPGISDGFCAVSGFLLFDFRTSDII
jgi:hypothetical protein